MRTPRDHNTVFIEVGTGFSTVRPIEFYGLSFEGPIGLLSRSYVSLRIRRSDRHSSYYVGKFCQNHRLVPIPKFTRIFQTIPGPDRPTRHEIRFYGHANWRFVGR
jgi:hypothetical protein